MVSALIGLAALFASLCLIAYQSDETRMESPMSDAEVFCDIMCDEGN